MTQLSEAEIQERLKNLTPEQMQELIKQQCVFCKIVAGEIPTHKVYEDNNFLAFLDVNPANVGHTLVIPKVHISVLPQLPDELAATLAVLVKQLSGKIFEATGAEGVNILQNNGQAAGQVVPHVHFHIIPRFPEDKISFAWEPKKLIEDQFKEAQKKIVNAIGGKAENSPAIQQIEKPSAPSQKSAEDTSEQTPRASSKAEGKPKKEKSPKIKSRLP